MLAFDKKGRVSRRKKHSEKKKTQNTGVKYHMNAFLINHSARRVNIYLNICTIMEIDQVKC